VLQVLRAADLLTRIGDSRVFGKKLTQAQFNVLMVLKRLGNGGISQKDILDNLVSTKGNVSIHIRNLGRMGYIRKRTSRSDTRMNVITLTAKGRRILEELEPRYLRHLKEITDDVPAKQAETAMAVLNHLQDKCRASLDESDAPRKGGS